MGMHLMQLLLAMSVVLLNKGTCVFSIIHIVHTTVTPTWCCYLSILICLNLLTMECNQTNIT